MTLPIPKLVLDPRNENELLDQAKSRVTNANKDLADFTPGSPILAILEGQVFATAELLYYANMLPMATALEVLRLSGATRNEGTKAKGELTFTLDRPLGSSFNIPTARVFEHRGLQYVLTTPLSIPAGAMVGKANCEAIAPGSRYNVSAFTINIRNTALTYLTSITNTDPITGGTDPETIQSFLRSAQNQLRRRGTLVSASDFEERAIELLGAGSNAKAFPLLDSAKEPEKLGHVHVFLLDSDGNAPNTATITSIRATLQSEITAAASVWVSAPDRQDAELHIVAHVDALSSELADSIYARIKSELSPANFALGARLSIRDIEYWARLAGAKDTPLVTINGVSTDLLMPTAWTLVRLRGVTLDLSNDGITETRVYGDGPGVGHSE